MGFKDMMKNFLYESVEDDELEEEEPVSSAPAPKAQPAPQPAAQPVAAPAMHPAQEVEAVEQTSPVDRYLINQDQQQASGSFLSDIEDVVLADQQPAPRAKKGVRPARAAKHAAPARQNPRMDYSAVISPIYGNMSNAEKDVTKVHDAINLPKPEDSLDMVEVISPMYGSSKPAPQPRKLQNPAKEMKAAPSKDARDLEPIMVQEELPAPADLGDFLTGTTGKNKNNSNPKKGGGKR